MPRQYKPSCECGKCEKCKSRERMRKKRAENPAFAQAQRKKSSQINAIRRAENRVLSRQKARDDYAANKEARKAAIARGWSKSPEKQAARIEVAKALKRGDLVKKPCERCFDLGIVTTDDVQAHHEDYSKPLEVIWLCTTHHYDRERELKIERESSVMSTLTGHVRIPYGPDSLWAARKGIISHGESCGHCGAEWGSLHNDECEVEMCTSCGLQLSLCEHGDEYFGKVDRGHKLPGPINLDSLQLDVEKI